MGISTKLLGVGAQLKALTVEFQRGGSYGWYGWNQRLPRTNIDYQREIKDGLGSPIILAVVGWRSRNFPQARLRLQRQMADGELAEIPPAEFGLGAMLSLIEQPNPFYSGQLLWRATVAEKTTMGNAYWLKERGPSAGRYPGRVVRLWWIPSSLIEPRWPQDGSAFISHYDYTPNGVPIRIEPQDIVHFREGMDPRNPRKGLSALGALAREIYTDDEAANFSATILTNLGVPGVVVSPKVLQPQSLPSGPGADLDTKKSMWMDKFGGDKRGEPAFFNVPTDAQVISFSPQQMALKDLRRIPEERVTAVTGIPAIVAGLGAGLDRSTFQNYDEARQAAYEENIIPDQGAVAPELKIQLLDEFGDTTGVIVDFDNSKVRVLQEDQSQLWTRNLEAWKSGAITRYVFLTNTSQPAEKQRDDVFLVPVNTQLIAAEAPEARGEEPTPTPIPEIGAGDLPRLLAGGADQRAAQ